MALWNASSADFLQDKEWSDVVECLRKLDITTDDLREAGGNETKIPKKFDDVLYPCGKGAGVR